MGKSKHRKNHKQKARAYKQELRDGAKRHYKFLVEQRDKLINELKLSGMYMGTKQVDDALVQEAEVVS
jgi:hypothetical protein